jgi:hypothetical protein
MGEFSQILTELQRLNNDIRALTGKIDAMEERQWHIYYEIVKIGVVPAFQGSGKFLPSLGADVVSKVD